MKKVTNRPLKRIEICTLLNMRIIEFRYLERQGKLPKSYFNGNGQRWSEQDIMEWAKTWKK